MTKLRNEPTICLKSKHMYSCQVPALGRRHWVSSRDDPSASVRGLTFEEFVAFLHVVQLVGGDVNDVVALVSRRGEERLGSGAAWAWTLRASRPAAPGE